MILFTFDLETENYESNKRKASPFDMRNYVVQAGWSVNGGEAHEKYFDKWHRDPVLPVEILDKMGEGDMFIGFNIKFDMLWVWTEPAFQAALKRGATVYCGQYAEYLLGGQVQEVQMVAMNDIAEQYGGGVKIDAVKEMWNDGYLTSQVPRQLLTDYLIGDGGEVVGDIMNTWKIFVGQVARMKANHPKEFRVMLQHRMDGLLATTEMEFNGVHCDAEIGEELRKQIVLDMETARIELEGFIPKLPPELVFNWGSNVHKSCLIFGGTVKYLKWLPHTDEHGQVLYAQKKVQYPLFGGLPYPPSECKKAGALYVIEVPQGQGFEYKGKWYKAQDSYLSGKKMGEGKTKIMTEPDETKPKGAKQPHYFKFDGYTKPHHSWKGESTDAYDQPLYSVGADIIEVLSKRGLPFTNALSAFTSLVKDVGTYYWTEDKNGKRKGMMTLINDGIIHHKLNHTSTITTRLSSSDPNLQNVPKGQTSNVKKMFTSRFKDGKVVEIDYSQLEVVIQGVLTGDTQLMADLNNKVDFHCKRLAKKLDETYEYVWNKHHVDKDKTYGELRGLAKKFSFERAYGAGAAAIAESTGMPIDDVKALIMAEEAMYPGLVEFDKMLERAILASRTPTERKLFLDGIAFSQGQGHWDSPTGTRYIWRENITPEFMHAHGKYTGFSPTERKNYPFQGFGGEVVQTQLGKVFRYFLANDRFNGDVLLTNTVHDCAWLDGKSDKVVKVALDVKAILQSVPEVFNKAFPNLNVRVPFPCEAEIGNDMFDMEGIH